MDAGGELARFGRIGVGDGHLVCLTFIVSHFRPLFYSSLFFPSCSLLAMTSMGAAELWRRWMGSLFVAQTILVSSPDVSYPFLARRMEVCARDDIKRVMTDDGQLRYR
jgi:hypothetical protein